MDLTNAAKACAYPVTAGLLKTAEPITRPLTQGGGGACRKRASGTPRRDQSRSVPARQRDVLCQSCYVHSVPGAYRRDGPQPLVPADHILTQTAISLYSPADCCSERTRSGLVRRTNQTRARGYKRVRPTLWSGALSLSARLSTGGTLC
jgi:hypothetical protein